MSGGPRRAFNVGWRPRWGPTMDNDELFASVGLARQQLATLRERLDQVTAAPAPTGMADTLAELLLLLDKLQARYELLDQILDRTNDIVFAKHRDGRYAIINPQGAALLGRTTEQILGSTDLQLFGRQAAERVMATDQEVMTSGVSQQHEESRGSGEPETVLLTTTSAWYDTAHAVRGVIGIAQDLTAARHREREHTSRLDRLGAIAAEIAISEEHLRHTLAAEMHDGLGQDLAVAKLKLSLLRTSTGGKLTAPLSGIELLIERADASLRSISVRISPASLHDLGLVAALQGLAEDALSRYGIAVRVEDHKSPPVVAERTRVILYRCVRELLMDAARAGHASEAVVTVARQGALVRITVDDQGAGHGSEHLVRRDEGLFGLREQLQCVDGSLSLDGTRLRGRRVTLLAPALAPDRGPAAQVGPR